jgi:hypothetical protein
VERDFAGERPIDVELDAVEPKLVARGNDSAAPAQLGHLAPVGSIARAGTDHARLDDIANPVPIEQQREAADVILVRMGQHDQVEPSVPGRHASVEQRQEAVWIRAGVDQHAAARRTLEEDRIALPDVEDRDVQAPVRPCQRDHGDEQ